MSHPPAGRTACRSPGAGPLTGAEDRARDDAARRRALRRLARTHHPDVGGDTETYLRLVASLRRSPGGRPTAEALVQVRPAVRWRLVLRRLGRRAARWVAQREQERRRQTDHQLQHRPRERRRRVTPVRLVRRRRRAG